MKKQILLSLALLLSMQSSFSMQNNEKINNEKPSLAAVSEASNKEGEPKKKAFLSNRQKAFGLFLAALLGTGAWWYGQSDNETLTGLKEKLNKLSPTEKETSLLKEELEKKIGLTPAERKEREERLAKAIKDTEEKKERELFNGRTLPQAAKQNNINKIQVVTFYLKSATPDQKKKLEEVAAYHGIELNPAKK
jgi:hypothetical protein